MPRLTLLTAFPSRLLARYSSNEALTEPDSVERGDPVDSLDLRIAQTETLGLTPYAIDEDKMAAYVKAYDARHGKPPTRNPAFEYDWYVARDSGGTLTTFIKCDSVKFRKDGIWREGDQRCAFQASNSPVPSLLFLVTPIRPAMFATAPNKKPGKYRAFCISTQLVSFCAASTTP